MRLKNLIATFVVLRLASASVSAAMAQSDAVAFPTSKSIVHYFVDRRSLPERLLNSVGLTTQDTGRSFAFIVGVSRYPKIQTQGDRYLVPAGRDLDLLFAYLKDQQFFDEIVVLRNDDVTSDNLQYFLETYFPAQLEKYPRSRFLFAYTGHGMTEGRYGYLLTSNATSLTDKTHSIDMSVLREYSNHTIDEAYQSLFLINACHSGAFSGKSSEGVWSMILNRPGAHAIMSSGRQDNSFGNENGSFFYQKLIDGLNGAADPTKKGVITVSDLGSYLQTAVGTATGGYQVPTLPQDIWSGVSDGGMFFFDRQIALRIADVPLWNPNNVQPLGEVGPSQVSEWPKPDDKAAMLEKGKRNLAARSSQLPQQTFERRADAVALNSSEELMYDDPFTKLMWTVHDNGKNVNWQEAIQYCSDLRLAGLSGWRLPSLKELALIYEPSSDRQPKLPKQIQLTGHAMWSSTKGDYNGPSGYAFFFNDGTRNADSIGKSAGHRALCVRPRQ